MAAAAAAAEFAAVFLETTLGTRFVVSFPASVTTVADLKRAFLSPFLLPSLTVPTGIFFFSLLVS